ncbi:MAG TPA: PKD domain-containing protein [Planctomycetota bacterium]|nr:PKD domain-containing protein [Planctomycetota bacterium]
MRLSFLAAALVVFSAALHAANDKTQANSYDNTWESAWVNRARTLYNGGSGKTGGFVLQIGDSITFANPYSQWPFWGPMSTEDAAIRTWARTNVSGANNFDTSCKNGFFLAKADTTAGRSMTAAGGIAAYEFLSGSGNGSTAMPADTNPSTARTKIASTTYVNDIHVETLAAAFNDACFAVLMLGTNDANAGRTSAQFIADLTAVVDKLEAQRIVVILSTIPPMTSGGASNVVPYNTAIRNFAQTRGLALIDYYAEILARRPGTTWQNTLISSDGVHPSASGGGYDSASDPYSGGGSSTTHTTGDSCANVGYLLRSWLTIQKLKEVKTYVVDGVNPPSGQVLTTITVTPNGTNVQAGSNVSFTATAYDQNGVAMNPQPASYTWTVPGAGGTSGSPLGVTAPTTAGSTFTVSASASGKTGSATNTVIPSTTLGSIVVSPSSATLNPGQQRQFSASARDPYGNTLATQPTFTWTASGGTISSSGLYTAGGTSGSGFSATASASGKSGSASITINSAPPVLTTIVVIPGSVTLLPSGTQQFTAAALDQFGNAMSPQPSFTWTQTGGSITSGGLYTAASTAGNFAVTASAGGKSGSANVTISTTPNQPPVINSATITPNPATVGAVVTFTASASDPESTTLTYAWNFGDGSNATGSSATHVYVTSTEYTITLTVTDGGGANVTRTFNLFVTAGGGGGGGSGGGGEGGGTPGGDTDGDGIPNDIDADDDNDGVSDSQEIAEGTDPNDAKSVKAQPLTVTKVLGSVKATAGGDSCSISGTIQNLPKGFSTAGVVLELNVGGAVESFTLDSKGRGKSAQGSISLSLKPALRDKLTKQVVFQGGNVAFKAKIAKGTWSDDWSDEGINTGVDAAGQPMTMTVMIKLNNTPYVTTVNATYTGKAGKGGKFQ